MRALVGALVALLASPLSAASFQSVDVAEPTSEILRWCHPSPPQDAAPNQTSRPRRVIATPELGSRRTDPVTAASDQTAVTPLAQPFISTTAMKVASVDSEGKAVFPALGAQRAFVVTVTAKEANALLSATLKSGGFNCVASDTLAAHVELVVPGGFNGELVVERHDLSAAKTSVEIAVDEAPLQASWIPNLYVSTTSAGRTYRMSIPEDRHRKLREFAEMNAMPCTSKTEPCFQRPGADRPRSSSIRQDEIASVYQWLAEIAGRSWLAEYAGSGSNSSSEPLIVFFGLAGANRTLLLDCRTDGARHKPPAAPPPCRFAEPWQTTLQHTKAIWVGYIEDEGSPFETTADVEFKSRAASVDYEEFDSRSATLGTAPPRADGRRIVRVGFRRFLLREAPVAVQVAFTRQGPSYGLRQWQRIYRKYSSRYWALAATVFVAAGDVDVQEVEIKRQPSVPSGTIALTSLNSPLFGGASFRLPGLRARALDQPNQLQRLLWNLVPDVTATTSFLKGVQVYGGSWPIWDRIYFTAGWKIARDRVLKPGFKEGDPVLPAIDKNDFSEVTTRVTTLVGFSIDVYRTR